VLYICIPVHNEAPTIGVLLWKIRGALQDFARDYELVVYDDASTDATAEVLEPYGRVLPLTVLSGSQRRGYGGALDALARYVATHTRYPRRDAMIVMQGDFTDQPEHIPEMVKRFEGGADVVVTERRMTDADPAAARRRRRRRRPRTA
jgi:glycosyltransferase involved in cell wall biosynthesis